MISKIEIKQIFRNLYRRRLYTSFNILGLGIGLGSVILLTTFLIHEYSFDRFHSKSSRIYRVVAGKSCGSYYAMGEAFKQEVPEIENVCRIANVSDIYTVILKHNNETFPINSFMAVDSSIFDMLDIEMIQGPVRFNNFSPKSVFISDKMAKKYFGTIDVVGKSFEFYISQQKQLMQVVGVFKHMPSYSSFQADFICDIKMAMDQFADLEVLLGLRNEKRAFDFYHDWSDRDDFTTFVLLPENVDIKLVEKKCTDLFLKHRDDLKDGGIHLQPFSEMYLHSDGLEKISSLKTNQFESLKIFLSIGILILLVACLNYILISSSEMELSFVEIACRKVNGASGKKIVGTVMFKSLLVCFISLIPAIVFVKLSMPLFNNFFQEELDFSLFLNWKYLAALLLITVLTAVLAGAYLSSIALKSNPVNLLQKNIQSRRSSRYLNKSLVVIQFIVFILLVSCMVVMKRQMNYSMSKDLGFDTNNLMVVELSTDNLKKQYSSIINEIIRIPNVVTCEPTTFMLPPNDNVLMAGFKDKETGESQEQEAIFLAPGNIELLKIPVTEGVSFSESNAKVTGNILLNEAAAKKFKVSAGENLYHFNVIGILKNFHYKSIHESIRPIFIIPQVSGFTNLVIKTAGSNNEIAEQIKKIMQGIDPAYYFEWEMLTERLSKFYEKDRKQTEIISFFSFVALILSFMGLFGFVSLSLSKRIKEIGIRKINGAKISEILIMLNKSYLMWIGISFVIACPVAWYAMHQWLENFAYKTVLSWWIFALAGLLAFMVAILTVSWQTWKAATRNPVEALRYE